MGGKSFVLNHIIPVIGYFFRAPKTLPVIYYHDIVEPGQELSLMRTNIDVFKSHMQMLKDEGYETFLFSEQPAYFQKGLNDKKVLITFDDGFLSNYTLALPIMRELGLKFNIFLAVDYIGTPGYLTETQIHEMQQTGLVEFGCHTYSHCDCRQPFDDKRYQREFVDSKKTLERILGQTVADFCFPFGYYNKEIIARLSADGLYRNLYLSNYTRPIRIDQSCITGRIGMDTNWGVGIAKKQIEGKYRIMHYYSKIRVGIPDVK